MRPVAFDYHRAEGLDHALELLATLGEEARPLAGGYSLVPMMNLRLARPMHLVDINGLGLDAIESHGGSVRLGGLVRHARLLDDALIGDVLPVLREAAVHIAHPTIRNRGTVGGSLAHADPTAELPLVAVLYDGVVIAASQQGERRINASEFFQGAFATALEPHEIVVALEMPTPAAGEAGGFVEFAERLGDFAIVAIGARVRAEGGRIAQAGIACAGAASVPVRGGEAEAMLIGQPLDDVGAAEAGQVLADACTPSADIRASAGYRKHLIAELTRRAVDLACRRAGGSA